MTHTPSPTTPNGGVPDIPLPPGAKTGDDWALISEGPHAGLYCRCVDWGDTWGNKMVVGITGVQFSDGRVERHLTVNFDDMHGNERTADVSADTAKDLAALLARSANKLNRSDNTAEKLAQTTAEMERLTQSLAVAAEKMRSSWSKPQRDNTSRGDDTTQVAEPHPALSHRCPFCHADPGQPCRTHRGRGRDLDWPHSRRIRLTHPLHQKAAKTDRSALCCQCGNLRTVSSNYNFRIADENRTYGEGSFDDPRGWRQTGTLLCTNCGKPTRHALLRDHDRHRDYAEDIQRYVLGGNWEGEYEPGETYRTQTRERYFKQFPRNPKLGHCFNVKKAEEARANGDTQMQAICGEPAKIPGAWSNEGRTMREEVEPDRIDWDTEFEDHDTGLWWVDMECVNCLRISNDRRRKWRRERLQYLLGWFSTHPDKIGEDDRGGLLDHLERLAEPHYSSKER